MHSEKLPVTLDWEPKDNPNPTFVESKQHAGGWSGMQGGECEFPVTTAKRSLREIPPWIHIVVFPRASGGKAGGG